MIHPSSPAEHQTFSVQYACIYSPPHWFDIDPIGLTLPEALRVARDTRQNTGRTCRVIEEISGRPTGHYVIGRHAPGTLV